LAKKTKVSKGVGGGEGPFPPPLALDEKK